jgi:hypothetical protein
VYETSILISMYSYVNIRHSRFTCADVGVHIGEDVGVHRDEDVGVHRDEDVGVVVLGLWYIGSGIIIESRV